MTELLNFIRNEYARQLKGVVSDDVLVAAGKKMEFSVRSTFAGERPYIAGHPKANRAVQLAELEKRSNLEAAKALGVTVRRIQQLRHR